MIATHVPHRVVVHYQPPFYERIEVVIPFCGVVVTIILVVVAVAVYWRRRRELQAEQLAAKVGHIYCNRVKRFLPGPQRPTRWRWSPILRSFVRHQPPSA